MNPASDAIVLMLLTSWIYYIFSAYCTWSFFTKRYNHTPSERPPVSVIKPLAGLDQNAFENLASFCRQSYPSYELIFAVASPADPAVPVVTKLQKEFPERRIKLAVASPAKGPNYKVGNLIAAIKIASHPLLVISDSDMRVTPNYLKEVVLCFLREKADLLTCLYRGTGITNIACACHSLTIQSDFIPNVLVDHKLRGISYAFGATICTTKESLEAIGGLEILQEYLADDYQLGYRLKSLGKTLVLSAYLLDHVGNFRGFGEYFLHQLRWAVTQRVCRPVGYTASLITRGVFLSVLLVISTKCSELSLMLLLSTLLLRLTTAALLDRTVFRGGEIGWYLWLIPINDILNTVIWGLSLVTNKVRWRGHLFKVLRDGRIIEINRTKHS